jgi:DNA polymerase III subunit delta
MSAAAYRILRKAIREQAFDRAYYLYGEDDFLKEDAVKQLIAGAVDPATRDFNLELRRGADIDAETLASLLQTPPMMADRRVVVIRDVPALKRDARAALERYLARPSADTVVVLVAPAGAKIDRTLLERATAMAFPLLTGDRIPKWIAHYAATELGASITLEAAELLQSAVGDDLPQLVSELDKLASYCNGRAIDETAVTDVVGVRRGETLGDLLDHIAERRATEALALVPHVLAQPKTTAVSVVMALSTQMLALAWGRAMREQGTPASRLEGEFFALLKEAKEAGNVITGRPWGEAIRTWARAVDHWSAAELDGALDALLAADLALKETRLSSDEQLLTSLVLTLCAPASRSAAA